MWTETQIYAGDVTGMMGGYLPTLLAAILVLIVGWLVAWVISVLARKALHRTSLDNQIAALVTGQDAQAEIEVEKWFSRAIFYFLMLFVLVAFFQVLGLPGITEPMNRFLVEVFEYLPRLIGPALLVLLAWILATTLRFVVRTLLERAGVDEKVVEHTRKDDQNVSETKTFPLSKTLSETVYWLVFLLFLPAILGPLGLDGILGPVQDMVGQLLGFLPQLLGAALIFAVGWFVARIVQRIVTSLLSALGTDRFAEQVGLSKALGKQSLSGLVGTIVYVLILIPVLIGALDALRLEALTRPASEMLNTILLALPNVFAAFLIIAIAYFVGRVVAGLVSTILSSVGFNTILQKLGVTQEPLEGRRSPSEIVGTLTLLAIVVLAASEAADLLGFTVFSTLVSQFIVFGGKVLLGIVIFGVGLYLANLASAAIRSSRAREAGLLSLGAQVAILFLSGAMALRQMGLANEIIQLAFGLILGAIAVAIALAFGLGARDAAAKQVERWQQNLESPSADKGGSPGKK